MLGGRVVAEHPFEAFDRAHSDQVLSDRLEALLSLALGKGSRQIHCGTLRPLPVIRAAAIMYKPIFVWR